MTVPPRTSWSYMRNTHSLLAMFGSASSSSNTVLVSGRSGLSSLMILEGVSILQGRQYSGPLVKKSRSTWNTCTPSHFSVTCFPGTTLPMTVASTSHMANRSRMRFTLCSDAASIMRSCDSETQTSQGASPLSFNGTLSRSTSAPHPPERAISPTTQDSPPPPRSFIPLMRPNEFTSRQAWMSGSLVIGSPN
ncbi:MAG: hypothetical protein A4E30_01211 [Methanomassiliicoccales archaeon PtaB.Bin215]|nr:MAG: hypothetical protein A4E30_01211 [Methanomassiliicoccales archaeon PtaB.Bin215]